MSQRFLPAMFCVLAVAHFARGDWTVLSVSRTETTRDVTGPVTAYGQSLGDSPEDSSFVTEEINTVAGFNVSGNVLNSSLISINSRTDTDLMAPGLQYVFYGSLDSDVISIQFQVSQQQPFSLQYTGTTDPLVILPNQVTLTGPSTSLSDVLQAPSPSLSTSGVLTPGTYTLSADWGYNTAPGIGNPADFYGFFQTDNVVFSFPEPTSLIWVSSTLVFALRRRRSLIDSPPAANSL